MTTPTVTELPLALQPVSNDPFLNGLEGASPSPKAPTRAGSTSSHGPTHTTAPSGERLAVLTAGAAAPPLPPYQPSDLLPQAGAHDARRYFAHRPATAVRRRPTSEGRLVHPVR
jgi:hypothetical protein